MNPLEFHFHKQGRLALMIVACILFFFIFTGPFALWVLWRRASGGIRLSDQGLEAKELGSSQSVRWNEVARIGVLQVPVLARGVGGMLARWRMGGPVATHLVFKTVKGKDRSVAVSSFEDFQRIIEESQKHVQRPLEVITSGVFSPKWPELRAAAAA